LCETIDEDVPLVQMLNETLRKKNDFADRSKILLDIEYNFVKAPKQFY